PFAKAIAFAKGFGAKMDLLLINTPGHFLSTEESEKRITGFLKGFDMPEYAMHVYNDYSVEKGVLNFARIADADLIGVGTHGRTGISHYLNGSIGEDIVNSAVRPVITFRIYLFYIFIKTISLLNSILTGFFSTQHMQFIRYFIVILPQC